MIDTELETQMRKSQTARLFALCATTVTATGLASAGTAAPTTRPGATAFKPYMADVVSNQRRFNALFPHITDLADPAVRRSSAKEGVDCLNHIVAGLRTALIAQPHKDPQLIESLNQYQATLIALGDDYTLAEITDREGSENADDALRAKRIYLQGNWLAAGPVSAKQMPLIDQATALAKSHPEDQALANTLDGLSGTAATPEIRQTLIDVISSDMKNPAAQRIKRNSISAALYDSQVGKPMTLTGSTVEGGTLSTGDWKGKVVLVDFWASWCGPCKAELPRVQKAYVEYHNKGLEVVGVSNDYKAEALKSYVAENKLGWPELFDAAAASDHEWNPITVNMGINSIPRMVLIDKKGICRSVTARTDFESQIPKLLSED